MLSNIRTENLCRKGSMKIRKILGSSQFSQRPTHAFGLRSLMLMFFHLICIFYYEIIQRLRSFLFSKVMLFVTHGIL